MGPGRLHEVEGPEEARRPDRLEARVVDLEQRLSDHVMGVVDEDVDRAEPRDRLVAAAHRIPRQDHVADEPDSAEVLRRARDPVRLAIDQRDPRPRRSQRPRDAEADALPTARDERDLPCETAFETPFDAAHRRYPRPPSSMSVVPVR
ncbi:MAG: hypothetical protein IPK00_04740 [Deltaproteobacteria bacterium]|nr:hypothetical protein [Deltaproteobacteria bacterium]